MSREDRETAEPEALGGRLDLTPPSALSAEQKDLYEYLERTKLSWASKAGFEAALPDGRLIGPFNVFLRSPKMARAFNGWVDAETETTSLSADVRQVIILTVGAAWSSAYEVYAHRAVGRKAGLSDATVATIVGGAQPEGLSKAAAVAYRFTRALVSDRAVSAEVYSAAIAELREQGVSDMVHLIGLYLATSALLNAFDVPSPA